MMLQTLPYSPSLQTFLMISIELLYVGSAAWKFAAVKHLTKWSSLVYIILQGALMVIFLALVLGMTFKGYKYGNDSTKHTFDRNMWGYGENVCMVVITIAIIVEFVLFLFSLILMTKNLLIMLLSMCMELKTQDSTQSLFVKKLIGEIKA